MTELKRIERIEDLADRMLKSPKYEDMPATEVYDLAEEIVDEKIAKAGR